MRLSLRRTCLARSSAEAEGEIVEIAIPMSAANFSTSADADMSAEESEE
jgi:hypothetical protein